MSNNCKEVNGSNIWTAKNYFRNLKINLRTRNQLKRNTKLKPAVTHSALLFVPFRRKRYAKQVISIYIRQKSGEQYFLPKQQRNKKCEWVSLSCLFLSHFVKLNNIMDAPRSNRSLLKCGWINI